MERVELHPWNCRWEGQSVQNCILVPETEIYCMKCLYCWLYCRLTQVRGSRYGPAYLEPEVNKEAYRKPPEQISEQEKAEWELRTVRPIKAAPSYITSSVFYDPMIRSECCCTLEMYSDIYCLITTTKITLWFCSHLNYPIIDISVWYTLTVNWNSQKRQHC